VAELCFALAGRRQQPSLSNFWRNP
jgi:hypothetical protein